MKIARRDCLALGAAAGAGALLSGCSSLLRRYTAPAPPKTVALPAEDVEPIARLLNRVAFGPCPGDADRLATIGRAAYVEEQLNPSEAESTSLMLRLRGLEALRMEGLELNDLPEREILRQMQQAALLRAVYSRHQLRERIVDFWSNHFNIYARKGFGTYYMPTDEVEVIRKHALGTFPDLLRASAHSPAMLAYLDNQVNRRGVANENYARELMELHTLGVDGGYTQRDVQEVARCLTGWTIEDRFMKPPRYLYARGTFRFDPALHDDGPKTVLGVPIPPGGGQKDGEQVLDILARHPSTARHVSRKLCRYFLGREDSDWTTKLSDTYLKTDGDIRTMLRPLLLSPDLSAAPPIVKRPFDFIASALRAFNADTDGIVAVQDHLERMGQPLYQWPMPDGYPDRTTAWTGSLLARWNFAFALTSDGIGGTTVDLSSLMHAANASNESEVADALVQVALSRSPTSDSLKPLVDRLRSHLMSASHGDAGSSSPLSEAAALLLAAPVFQWR